MKEHPGDRLQTRRLYAIMIIMMALVWVTFFGRMGETIMIDEDEEIPEYLMRSAEERKRDPKGVGSGRFIGS